MFLMVCLTWGHFVTLFDSNLISLVLLTKSMTPILDFLSREAVRLVPLARNICGQ